MANLPLPPSTSRGALRATAAATSTYTTTDLLPRLLERLVIGASKKIHSRWHLLLKSAAGGDDSCGRCDTHRAGRAADCLRVSAQSAIGRRRRRQRTGGASVCGVGQVRGGTRPAVCARLCARPLSLLHRNPKSALGHSGAVSARNRKRYIEMSIYR